MTDSRETLHIYTRVSTDAQEEKGTSLETQKSLGIEKANQLKMNYKIWNEGGESSSFEHFINRPELRGLLHAISAGEVKHLWVYNNDRLSRNEITAAQIRTALREHNVNFYTLGGKFNLNNPQDNLFKKMLDSFAEFDNEIRTDRTRLGKLNRIKEGFWMGGPPPYGYEIKDKKLALHPEESKWVQQIFEWYGSKKSIEWIKTELDSQGIYPRRNKKPWTLGSINKLLQNTHHMGQYNYTDSKTGETVKCICPNTISISLWNKCQEIRKQTLVRKGQNNRTKRFYLLRNFLYCKHCGSHMAGRIIPRKNENFYYCPRKERNWVKGSLKEKEKWVRGKGCSMIRSMNIHQTDKLVWNSVVDAISNSKFLEYEGKKFFDKMQKDEDALPSEVLKHKRLSKDLEIVESSISRVETDKILGKNIKQGVLENLYKEMARVQQEIEQSEIRMQQIKEKGALVDWASYFRSKMDFENYGPEEKQDYMKGVIRRIDVEYHNDNKEHELTIQFTLPLVNNFDDPWRGRAEKHGKIDLAVKLKKNQKVA